MTKPLVFMMGKSPCFLPVDRRYFPTHMWCCAADSENVLRLGFSAYAVKLLGDVKVVQWSVAAGSVITASHTIGHIEASKAVSDLFSPASGTIRTVNDAVVADPSLINSYPYDQAWLFEMVVSDDARSLSPQEYFEHVEKVWPLSQRMLKGQAGVSRENTP